MMETNYLIMNLVCCLIVLIVVNLDCEVRGAGAARPEPFSGRRIIGAQIFRGRTDLRQLVRLVYHAQGVLCPVTLLMHLAWISESASQSWCSPTGERPVRVRP
jgi:hypothetical protein